MKEVKLDLNKEGLYLKKDLSTHMSLLLMLCSEDLHPEVYIGCMSELIGYRQDSLIEAVWTSSKAMEEFIEGTDLHPIADVDVKLIKG